MENGYIIDLTPIYDDADKLAKDYKKEIVNANAVAKGKLANFSYDLVMRDDGLTLFFDLPDYWYYIENGRQPTKNPGDGSVLQRIREWIDDKGITPVPGADGKVPTLDSLAYAITKKIHKFGYFDLDGQHSQGKHLLRNTLENNAKVIDDMAQHLADALGQEVLIEIGKL